MPNGPEVEYGRSIPLTCRTVALLWDSQRIDDDPQRKSLENVAAQPGLYAIEGAHDASPSSTILYIGRTGHGDSKNVISSRLKDSLERVWWKNEKGALRLFSDVWDVRIRWASVTDQSLIEAIEHILIASHSPAFNSQKVRVPVPRKWSDVLVLNGGKKGRLLPAVFGGYFTPDLFPDH